MHEAVGGGGEVEVADHQPFGLGARGKDESARVGLGEGKVAKGEDGRVGGKGRRVLLQLPLHPQQEGRPGGGSHVMALPVRLRRLGAVPAGLGGGYTVSVIIRGHEGLVIAAAATSAGAGGRGGGGGGDGNGTWHGHGPHITPDAITAISTTPSRLGRLSATGIDTGPSPCSFRGGWAGVELVLARLHLNGWEAASAVRGSVPAVEAKARAVRTRILARAARLAT